MKKRGVRIVLGLMCASLLGVIAMQVYFLTESYRLKSELFDQAVNASLSNVVAKLEKQQAIYFINKEHADLSTPLQIAAVNASPDTKKTRRKPVSTALRAADSSEVKARQHDILLAQEQLEADRLFAQREFNILRRYPRVIPVGKTPVPSPGDRGTVNIQINEFEDAEGNVQGQITSQLVPGSVLERKKIAGKEGAYEFRHTLRMDTVKRFIVMDSAGIAKQVDLLKPVMRVLTQSGEKQLVRLVRAMTVKSKNVSEKTAKKMTDSMAILKNEETVTKIARQMQHEGLPLSLRIKFLDSTLRAELMNQGIEIPYKSRIKAYPKYAGGFLTAVSKDESTAANVYRTALFPNDLGPGGNQMLYLMFPGKQSVILSTMGAAMATTGALSLVLIFCFGYTLHSILRQKKISEMKTDFINNMTHEFKTPVATIMIASEGLKDPEAATDTGRVGRLAGIIYDENVRLANHIERVLNIARIDRQDLKLDHDAIDMNELVRAVTDSMSLQLQKREANLSLHLDATHPTVAGDELHLSNVIYNLVDNAIKYSIGAPDIALATLNSGQNLVIRVTDKGIGLNRDQLSKIFEQFYRVPTGNRHDVKGFGLGLSYVNNIVKKLGGTIRVKSEKDKGSEFELTFPIL